MNKWYCTKCAILATGRFPFDEKTIGGVGPRTCSDCEEVHNRTDGMHLIEVNNSCKCTACSIETNVRFPTRMIVCVECGNKRCPRALHHSNDCTNSNEPDQPESRYSKIEP